MILTSQAVIFDAFGTLLKIQNGRHPYRRLLKLGQSGGRRPRPDDAHVLMQEPLTLTEAAARLGINVKRSELYELEQLRATITAQARAGDYIVCMSNGGFGGIHQKLLQALQNRE